MRKENLGFEPWICFREVNRRVFSDWDEIFLTKNKNFRPVLEKIKKILTET